MALTIPEGELELSKQLTRPGFAAISLTNDLYSWEKERDAAKQNSLKHVVNVIWVLMKERSMTEDEAKGVCRAKIKDYIAEFVRAVEDAKHNYSLSLDVRKYVEAI